MPQAIVLHNHLGSHENVEFPVPYSKIKSVENSMLFSHSIAGFVDRGSGLPAASTRLPGRVVLGVESKRAGRPSVFFNRFPKNKKALGKQTVAIGEYCIDEVACGRDLAIAKPLSVVSEVAVSVQKDCEQFLVGEDTCDKRGFEVAVAVTPGPLPERRYFARRYSRSFPPRKLLKDCSTLATL